MGGRILIIVSYNGDRHPTGFNPYEFLDIQHQQLSRLKHGLDEVCIVVNEAWGPDKDYDEALKQFPYVLHRENQQGSYGAWRDGYLLNPGYEWYFFLEDDYTFFLDDFDQKWIDLWKPGMSYNAMKIGEDHGYPPHTSISNGLTRGDILDKIDFRNMGGQGEYDAMLQLGWSGLFATEGLADIRDTYACPFIAHNILMQHGNPNLPVLIGPIQLHKPRPTGREIDPARHKQRVAEDYDYMVRTSET